MANQNNPVIIVKMSGGLGNQMFQYAAAKSFALENAAFLKLDISVFENQLSTETPRKWGLHIFPGIEEKFSVVNETTAIRPLFANRFFNRLYRLIVKKFSWINRHYLVERSFFFVPLKLVSYRLYMDGYWQSYKYFVKHESAIRQLFDLGHLEKEPSIEKNIQKIRTTTSVSLHVRRGDYVTNKHAKKFNGICNLAYYEEAIEKIKLKEKEPIHIFIFSDDIEWSRKNIKFTENCTFLNTISDACDLYLMSICKHNIIANSTFSWWAGWLNNNSEKIVVAPKKWHRGFKDNIYDILLDCWIKID